VPGRFVQSEQMRREIEATVAQVQKLWDDRDELVKDALQGLGDFYRRKKRIFYDTDMINESQEETVRLCPKCSGYMTISSQAQRGYGILNSAFCVSIPRKACASCREDAKEEYEEHIDDCRIGYVCMQDKDRDTFKFHNNMTHTQKSY
ncbi:MAG TPA: histone deacetylase, partial [Methanothrix sp.]|nr:histone deacetylase [Methanothrix sp.]